MLEKIVHCSHCVFSPLCCHFSKKRFTLIAVLLSKSTFLAITKTKKENNVRRAYNFIFLLLGKSSEQHCLFLWN